MLDLLKNNIVGFLGILLGFFGIFIFWLESRWRARQHSREIDLLEKKYQSEEEDRKKKQSWLETQQMTLKEMSLTLSEKIAAELRRDSRWAAEALERTKLGPYADTLFGERRNHFREEKELIAQKFVPMLLQRIKYMVEQSNRVQDIYLCVDSGTTLFPIFGNIALETAKAYHQNEKWIDSLTIVTNNLPGVEALMENGRTNPGDRFSSLAIRCKVLPGSPLPIYSAITGEDTERELQNLKDSASNDAVFIGLTTGNWVRIRKSNPRCPVPLSRGGRHPEFKQKLIEVCQEIYVVAPLGKIFANMSEEEVNTMLKLKPGAVEPSKMAYKEAFISDACAKIVRLISTRRKKTRLLGSLSSYLNGQLLTKDIDGDNTEFIEAPIGKTHHFQFSFDVLPMDEYLEKEIEFPHAYTRKSEFTEHFMNPGNQ